MSHPVAVLKRIGRWGVYLHHDLVKTYPSWDEALTAGNDIAWGIQPH